MAKLIEDTYQTIPTICGSGHAYDLRCFDFYVCGQCVERWHGVLLRMGRGCERLHDVIDECIAEDNLGARRFAGPRKMTW